MNSNNENEGIGLILRDVHSIGELSLEHIDQIRSEQTIEIDKFQVSCGEFLEWVDQVGSDIRGIEYDAQARHLIIKQCPGGLHETASVALGDWLGVVGTALGHATGSDFERKGTQDCSLLGDFEGSVKQPDGSLYHLGAWWPIIIFEVGVSESTNQLFRDAEKWLNGTDGHTKLVILVDIQESGRRGMLNDTWGLTGSQVTNFDLKALANHISEWYANHAISVLGTFTVKVYLCQRDHAPNCILHTRVSSTSEVSAPRVTIRLRDIVPEIAHEADSELVLPFVELINSLQLSLKGVQGERYMKAAAEAKKRSRN